jgi:glutamate---cysteine ligase / carboxylate-amine ligase
LKEDLVFSKSKAYTLGVELEFQLVDRNTLDLVPRVRSILDNLVPGGSDRIVPEFLQSIIEIQTGVCDCVSEVAADLGRTIQLVEDVADTKDCILYSASLHPFAEPDEQEVSDGERYKRIMQELQYVGRQFISQGLHVHVGVGEGDTAIRVCDIMQAYLPILLGLSTSSPYFKGEDTGFHSYRTKLFESLPLAGIAGFLGSWQGFADEVAFLQKCQVIKQIKDLWWDIRPSPGFGTVEVRICDLPSRFSEILGMVAVIQALVAYIAESEITPFPVSLQLLRSNKWQAARHGLDGRFNDPYGLLDRPKQPLRQAAEELFVLVRPFLERFQTMEYVQVMRDVLKYGTSADHQRALVAQGKTYKDMISRLRDDYWIHEEKI